nr:hypothetical protein [uncultured Campylobacter sp.]
MEKCNETKHNKLWEALKSVNIGNLKIEKDKAYFEFEKSTKSAEEVFKEIAEILLTQTKIVKGSQEYYITDIEFYLYCKGHKDIITYPRKCEAGEWFFHGSGVDISFASNVKFQNGKAKLSDNLFFGGILIRGIKRFNENNKLSDNGVNGIILKDKPSNVFYELFRNFDAFCGKVEFPKLVACKNGQKVSNDKTIRKNIIKDCATQTKLDSLKENKLDKLILAKLDYISSNYDKDKSDFIKIFQSDFSKFIEAKYRYKVTNS